MHTIKFTQLEITQVLDTVVALLNLGNVEFQEDDDKVTTTPQTNDFCTKAA
jgi:myosin heavy subunit